MARIHRTQCVCWTLTFKINFEVSEVHILQYSSSCVDCHRAITGIHSKTLNRYKEWFSVADDVTHPSTSDWYGSGNCSWVDAVSWGCNGTVNTTGANATTSDVTSLVLMAVTSVVLALIILATIVGEICNTLVRIGIRDSEIFLCRSHDVVVFIL